MVAWEVERECEETEGSVGRQRGTDSLSCEERTGSHERSGRTLVKLDLVGYEWRRHLRRERGGREVVGRERGRERAIGRLQNHRNNWSTDTLRVFITPQPSSPSIPTTALLP